MRLWLLFKISGVCWYFLLEVSWRIGFRLQVPDQTFVDFRVRPLSKPWQCSSGLSPGSATSPTLGGVCVSLGSAPSAVNTCLYDVYECAAWWWAQGFISNSRDQFSKLVSLWFLQYFLSSWGIFGPPPRKLWLYLPCSAVHSHSGVCLQNWALGGHIEKKKSNGVGTFFCKHNSSD